MTKILINKGLILLVAVLLNCNNAFSQSSVKVVDKLVTFGYKAAAHRNVDVIIIHSTFNNSGGEFYDIDLVIKQFSRYGVSAHYVIGRDGTIFRLVNENNISYHAGKSQLPDGRIGLNTCSIGIELMTSFTESPTELQIQALATLVNDIKLRYPVKYVLRHSDIAPGRKTDPWNMDWDDFLKRIK
jgi:N-acetyl-anhydromuramyl-L-alanine amidase AmpD